LTALFFLKALIFLIFVTRESTKWLVNPGSHNRSLKIWRVSGRETSTWMLLRHSTGQFNILHSFTYSVAFALKVVAEFVLLSVAQKIILTYFQGIVVFN